MSEPETAFLKLEITRSALVRWLRAKPSPASGAAAADRVRDRW